MITVTKKWAIGEWENRCKLSYLPFGRSVEFGCSRVFCDEYGRITTMPVLVSQKHPIVDFDRHSETVWFARFDSGSNIVVMKYIISER